MMIEGGLIAIGFWGGLGVVLGIVVGFTGAGLLIYHIMEIRDQPRIKRVHDKHAETHPPLSDELFVQQLGVPTERGDVALRVRKIFAQAICCDSPETLYPSDKLEYFDEFVFDGLDLVEVVLEIEDDLHIRIRDRFLEDPRDVTLRDVVQGIVQNLEAWRIPANRKRVRK